MSEYIIQEDTLKYLAAAIREKAGLTDGMTPEDMEREIYLLETDTDIGAPADGVTFYDYDGTVLYHYTVKEARALATLPDAPIHDGLPFAGWTHTLEEVNATMKCLDVGATYEPETIKLTIDFSKQLNNYYNNNGLTVTLYFAQSESNGVSINWGDGSSVQTVSGTGAVSVSHSYAATGEYVIEFMVNAGTLTFGKDDANDYLFGGKSDSTYSIKNYILTKMILSTINVNYSSNFLSNSDNLSTIVIPNGMITIPSNCFQSCSIKAVIIPSSVSNIGVYAFRNNPLTVCVFSSGCEYDGSTYSFYQCRSLERVIISAGMGAGHKMFDECSAMKELHLRMPKPSVFNYGYVFPDSCIIYVPVISLEYYKTNFPNVKCEFKGEPYPTL